MAITLPAHVASMLNIAGPEELDAISDRVKAVSDSIDPLRTEDSQTSFVAQIQQLPTISDVEIARSTLPIAAWQLRKIEFDGIECANSVEIPASLLDANQQFILPPTNAEPLLVRSWLASDQLISVDGQYRKNIVAIEWRPNTSEATKGIVRAICGISPAQGVGAAARAWTSAPTIGLRSESRVLNHKDKGLLSRLFSEAATESIVRWRFLSLYRILEHGYLENIFEEFSKRFFSEPKDAVDGIGNALKSEMEQFIRLIESHDLKSWFEEMEKINNTLVAGGNQFAILIEKESKKRNYQESYKRGASLCYQIRCSIVHAGSYSVVFDKSPGSDDAVLSHLVELEKAVAHFLGIQIA